MATAVMAGRSGSQPVTSWGLAHNELRNFEPEIFVSKPPQFHHYKLPGSLDVSLTLRNQPVALQL